MTVSLGSVVSIRTTLVNLLCPFLTSLLTRFITHVTDEYEDQPLFANTDMAKNWHKLGFIVQRPSYGPEPIFVETQRGIIHREKKGVADPVHSPEAEKQRRGPRGLPKPDSPDQPIMSVESLCKHLQTAMAIELATIPLYLFGMYSIKIPDQYANDPRYYDPVIAAIRSSYTFIGRLSFLLIFHRCSLRGNAPPQSCWEYLTCGWWDSEALRCRLHAIVPDVDAWTCS